MSVGSILITILVWFIGVYVLAELISWMTGVATGRSIKMRLKEWLRSKGVSVK